jgi:hypothetical protein
MKNYSELLPGMEDLQRFPEFKEKELSDLDAGILRTLYYIDEGSAFYTVVGLMYLQSIQEEYGKNFRGADLFIIAHQLGKRKFGALEYWTMGQTPLQHEEKLMLGLLMSWQDRSGMVLINEVERYSEISEGNYASKNRSNWFEFLEVGIRWMAQRTEVIGYVATNHYILNNVQYRINLRNLVEQTSRMYRGKSYQEFLGIIAQAHDTYIGRKKNV